MEWHQRHPTGQLLSNANSDVEAAWGPIAPLPMAVGTVAMMVIAVAQMLLADLVLAVVGLLVFPAVVTANLFYQRLASPLMTRAQQLRGEVSEIAHESFDGAMVVKTLGRESRGDPAVRGQGRGAARRQHPRRPHPRGVRPGPGRAAEPRRPARAGRRRHPRAQRPVAWRATWSPSPTCSPSSPSRSARSAGCSGSSRAAWSASAGSRRSSTRPARCRTATAPLPPGGAARTRVRGWRCSTSATPTTRTSRCSTTSVRPSSPVGPSRSSGPPPSGKSTLTTLLTRLVDPDRGRIRVDGVDLRDLGPGGWPTAVAVVPQTAFLFDDTVRGNVTLGRRRRRRRGLGGAARRPGRRLRRRPAARPRHPPGRARHVAVRRSAPAHLPGAGPRPASPAAGPRRRDLRGRPRGGGPDPRRPPGGRAATRPWSWSPTARPPSGWPTRSCTWRAAGSSTRGTHAELLAASPSYARLVNAYEQPESDESARRAGRGG